MTAQARGASPIAFSSPSSGGDAGERSLSPIGEDEKMVEQEQVKKKSVPATKGGRKSTGATGGRKKASMAEKKSTTPASASPVPPPPAAVVSTLDAEEDTKDFQMLDMENSSDGGGGSDVEEDPFGEQAPSTSISVGNTTISIPAPFEPLQPPKRQKKKESKVSVAKLATSELHQTSTSSKLAPVPDWIDKPPPEVYKQMSSKEKRQLRNKISARNFRHRRKEYITTLEDAIKERDAAISSLTVSLNELKVENDELKSENKELKSKWEDLVNKTTSLLPSTISPSTSSSPLHTPISQVGLGPPTSIAAALTSSGRYEVPRRVTSPGLRPGGIDIPNVNKDLNINGKRFGTSPLGGSGGFLSVHTALVPELRLPQQGVAEKKNDYSRFEGGNMNPNLNNLSASQSSLLPLLTSHLRGNGETGKNGSGKGLHDDFFGSNPYWLKPSDVEEYRSQLYGKLNNNLAMNLAMGVSGGRERELDDVIMRDRDGVKGEEKVKPMPVPIGTGWRPAFFMMPGSRLGRKESDASLSSIGSNDYSNSSPPPSYSSLDHLDLASPSMEIPRSSLLASQEVKPKPSPSLLGSSTLDARKDSGLFGKMMDSFWTAFSGPVGSGGLGVGKRDDEFGRMFPKRFGDNNNNVKKADDEVETLGKGLEKLKVAGN